MCVEVESINSCNISPYIFYTNNASAHTFTHCTAPKNMEEPKSTSTKLFLRIPTLHDIIDYNH